MQREISLVGWLLGKSLTNLSTSVGSLIGIIFSNISPAMSSLSLITRNTNLVVVIIYYSAFLGQMKNFVWGLVRSWIHPRTYPKNAYWLHCYLKFCHLILYNFRPYTYYCMHKSLSDFQFSSSVEAHINFLCEILSKYIQHCPGSRKCKADKGKAETMDDCSRLNDGQ